MGGKSQSRKGKVRKNNDTVDLKPRSADGGSGGGGRGVDHQCVAGFELPLPGAKDMAVGTRLSLQQENGSWLVIANGRPVGSIGKGRSEMLTECLGIGYRYRGELRARDDRKYGAFQRSS